MPPHPNASPQPDDWLDQALHQAFAAELGVGPPVVAEIEDIEDVLAAVPLAEGGATASQGKLWLALAPGSRYEVLGEAARGGLGIVYRGHDRDLGREVALKALDRRLAADPGFVRRFVAEARVCGRLQHPGIVPVHELGLDQTECPYFVMKLITGQTFAQVLAARITPDDDRRRCLDAFEKVCHTIAYAHDQGVVHRDLKPANVMIGAFGEVQVVDWGLALVLANLPDRTCDAANPPAAVAPGRSPSLAGAVSGTPAYMSPEQARGETPRIDARSDVFALGAMLAEILTGMPVHARELDTRLQIDRTARGDLSLVQRRLHESGAEPELVSLALVCLAPTMADRPASAAVVAKAIGDHLAAVEERSRQAQLRAVAARANARATLMVASLVVIMLMTGSGAFLWWLEESHRKESAATARVDAAAAEVVRLTERARAGDGLDLGAWEQARFAAQQTVQLAAALPVTSSMRDRLRLMELELTRDQRVVRQQVDRRERDRDMIQRLIAVRVPKAVLAQSNENRLFDKGYRELFTVYLGGRDLFTLSESDAVEALRSEIQAELVTGLDLWALALTRSIGQNKSSGPAVARLKSLARQLDRGDARRNKLRDLVGDDNRAELERISNELDLATLSASTIILLAEQLASSGSPEHAIAIYQRACDLYPRDTSAAIGIARLQMQMGAPEEALGYWRIARTLAPNHSGVHLQLGYCLEQLRRFHEAVACYKESLEIAPAMELAARNLHNALRRLGRHDDADAVLEECASALFTALNRDPWNTELRIDLAGVYIQQRRARDAVQQLRLVLHPMHRVTNVPWDLWATAYRRMGEALSGLGQHGDALIWLRRSLRLRPLEPSTHSSLGVALWGVGDIDEALGFLRRAVALAADDPTCLSKLGFVLVQNGQLVEGIEHLARALAIYPHDALAERSLGEAFLRSGRANEALAHLDASLALDPRDAIAWHLQSSALTRLERPKEAIASNFKAIALAPEVPGYYRSLVELLLYGGQRAR
jgi:tetratricopeptide (TPR) repeat protein